MKLRKRNEGGFTLVEILIILPIVSITILVLVDFMVRTYFQLYKENAQVNLRLEAETMLLDLEDELLFATDYGNDMSSDLSDPHQPSGGWTYNTNPDTFIVHETTLTAPRRDPNRDFVYKNTYGCTGSNSAYNPIALNNLMYFTSDNPENDYYTLYRRTITPGYSTCGTNYKRKTCPEVSVGTNGCTAADSKLTTKLKDIDLEYFDENNAIVSQPIQAERVKVTVTLAEKQYAEEIQIKASISMKKVN